MPNPPTTRYREASRQQLALWEWLGRDRAAEVFAIQDWGAQHPNQLMATEIVLPAIQGKMTEKARAQALLMRRFLISAQPYYWSADMTRALHGAAERLPPETRLRRDLFPGPYGYHWFEEPIPIPVHPDTQLYTQDPTADWLRGFFWFPFVMSTLKDDPKRVHDRWQGGSDETGVFFAFIIEDNDLRYGGVVQGAYGWEFDQSLGEVYQQEQARHNPVTDPDQSPRTLAKLQHALAAQLFLRMPVVKHVHHSVGRDERHLWERSKEEPPEVEVVYLRRYQYVNEEEPTPPGSVDWSCRWWVGTETGGFWRTYHRGTPDEKSTFVFPFVKGPAHKPLKAPASKLFAVIH
jgi:hypothetical protein